MAYRLDLARPLPAELDRIVDHQLARAVARLEGTVDEGDVHSVRKRTKKVRALLRLARGGLGDARGEANHLLRDVAHRLGRARDAAADVEVVDALLARTPADQVTRVALLRERLAAIAADAHDDGAVAPEVAADAAEDLAEVGRMLRPAHSGVRGWADLEPGFERQYRRGRTRYEALDAVPTADHLHEWRKRVKDLGYHARLLRDLWPEVVGPTAEAASELSDLLGDDHDLARVAGHLHDPGHLGALDLDDGDLAGIAAVIADERARLQRRARHLGALLYADPPEAWVHRHRTWWRQGRRTAAHA